MCCFLCVEVAKQNMTPLEVARAYFEMTENDHVSDLMVAIEKNIEGGSSAVAVELSKLYDEHDRGCEE